MASEREREIRAQLGFKEQIVYHYCSLEALFGIVSSQSFWLTSLESTNDNKELKYGKKLLDDVLKEMISDEQDIGMKKIFEQISVAPADVEYKKHRKSYRYYGSSFVGHNDSLTHWERYGDGGYGVCIALNMWMIKHFFEYRSLPDVCTTWFWHNKIIYNESLQKEYLKKSILSKIDGFLSKVDILTAYMICNTIYYTTLAQGKPLFKHSGFSDENEYRLVFEEGQVEELSDYLFKIAPTTDDEEFFFKISNRIKEAASDLNLLQENKRHSVIGKSIRSFYSLKLNHIWGDALIPEIIIGPRCYQNKKELSSFLKSNGLNGTKVRISDIPIR